MTVVLFWNTLKIHFTATFAFREGWTLRRSFFFFTSVLQIKSCLQSAVLHTWTNAGFLSSCRYAIALFTSLQLKSSRVDLTNSVVSITNFYPPIQLPKNPGSAFRQILNLCHFKHKFLFVANTFCANWTQFGLLLLLERRWESSDYSSSSSLPSLSTGKGL